jgi:hypothetical protein
MKPKPLSSKDPGTCAPRRSMGEALASLMERTGVPLTRESYLDLEYNGNPPKHLSVEQEMDLPAQFRKL